VGPASKRGRRPMFAFIAHPQKGEARWCPDCTSSSRRFRARAQAWNKRSRRIASAQNTRWVASVAVGSSSIDGLPQLSHPGVIVAVPSCGCFAYLRGRADTVLTIPRMESVPSMTAVTARASGAAVIAATPITRQG